MLVPNPDKVWPFMPEGSEGPGWLALIEEALTSLAELEDLDLPSTMFDEIVWAHGDLRVDDDVVGPFIAMKLWDAPAVDTFLTRHRTLEYDVTDNGTLDWSGAMATHVSAARSLTMRAALTACGAEW